MVINAANSIVLRNCHSNPDFSNNSVTSHIEATPPLAESSNDCSHFKQ
jgi:hypothetical protein